MSDGWVSELSSISCSWLLLLWLLSFLLLWLHRSFQAEKKEEILEQARLLMESAQAIRDYTSG